ncbi:MAG: SCO family protein [Rhodobacterales bacterium]
MTKTHHPNRLRGLQTILWGATAIAALAVGAALLWRTDHVPAGSGTIMTGEAAILNDYHLTDHYGQSVTPESYAGTWQMVFFGFTHCPDVCPMTLAYMSDVMDSLGSDAAHVTPIFITVDPERDTIEVMDAYASAFHPALVGLTGTQAQVDTAARNFRVWHERAEDETALDGYTLIHTGYIHIMRPDGRFEDVVYEGGQTPENFAERLSMLIKKGSQ